MNILNKFERNKVFSNDEAWTIFRIAAIAEAVGWTILITGILISKYLTPDSNFAVIFAGRIHGILFFGYALAAVGLYPSLKWSRPKAIIALLASIPPYGSLIIEQYEQHKRNHQEFKLYSNYLLLYIVCETFKY